MKKSILLLYVFLSLNTFAQDEYNQKKKEVEPAPKVNTKTDSIEVDAPKEKPKEIEKTMPSGELSNFKKNLRLGGGFNIGTINLQASKNQAFYITLSPQLTYKLSEYFEGGLSTSYTYLGTFDAINSHAISAGPILRAYPSKEFFIQMEGLGFFNYQSVNNQSATFKNFNAFIGGGMVQQFSESVYLITGIKVNLMKNELTDNQIIPIGFTSIHFGLFKQK